MNEITRRRGTAAAVALLLCGLAWGAGPRTALITDLKGQVQVVRGKQTLAASLLQVLSEGDQLKVAGAGQATLSYFGDGRMDVVTGECRVEVRARQTRLMSGPTSAVQSQRGASTRALVPKGQNLERLGGNIVAALDHPSQTVFAMMVGTQLSAQRVFLSPPRFRMRTDGPVTLSVLGPGGGAVWTTTAQESPVQGPELAPGRYTLNTRDPQGLESSFPFQVLDAKAAGQVRAAEAEEKRLRESHPEDLSPTLLLVGVYLERGLLGEAWDAAVRANGARLGDRSLDAMVDILGEQLWAPPSDP